MRLLLGGGRLEAFNRFFSSLPPKAGFKAGEKPKTYDAIKRSTRRRNPTKSEARRAPPPFAQGQILHELENKQLKSFVHQTIDALKKATLNQGGELTTDVFLRCLQSAAACRTKAFQLIQGQILLTQKLNRLTIFAVEGFIGKVSNKIPDQQWTFLRNQEVKYDEKNCIVHHLVGYKVAERRLSDGDIIAQLPAASKSPTSYRAFLKAEIITCKPDWVLSVVLHSSKRYNSKTKTMEDKKPVNRFDAIAEMKKTMEDHGVPWYWLYNAWEARLQVFQHTTPHASGGKLELQGEYQLDSDAYQDSWTAQPFSDVELGLREILGYRKNWRTFV